MYLSISLYFSFTVCWFIPLYVSVCLNIYTSKETFSVIFNQLGDGRSVESASNYLSLSLCIYL